MRMLQKQLLSFEEVGVEFGCSVGTVRSLVVEERSLPALVVTLTGGKQPYGAQTIERIDDDGTVLVLHDRPSRFERGFKAYLRVERIALTTFMAERGIEADGTRGASGTHWPKHDTDKLTALRLAAVKF